MHLKDYLDRTNTTQAAFAARVGCRQGTISRLCRDVPGHCSLALALRIEAETGGAVPVETWPRLAALADRKAPTYGK